MIGYCATGGGSRCWGGLLTPLYHGPLGRLSKRRQGGPWAPSTLQCEFPGNLLMIMSGCCLGSTGVVCFLLSPNGFQQGRKTSTCQSPWIVAYDQWDVRLVDAELSGQNSFDLSRLLCSGARSVDSLSLSLFLVSLSCRVGSTRGTYFKGSVKGSVSQSVN